MDNYTHEKTSGIRRREKKKKKDEASASLFQVAYIHNHVKLFWLLTLTTRFNVGNNLTTNNTYNILSDIPCSLTKISHGFTKNKTKNHGSCNHGNHKLTMVLILQIIVYKEVLG